MGTELKFFMLIVIFAFLFSCEKIEERDDYRRPDWLVGKLYDQIVAQEDLSSFAKALELTGYDTIINVSGSYTVFAPTNEAFDLFFSKHPQFGGSVAGIPQEKLLEIVKFHIIQNPWNRVQLQSLNSHGWITDDDHPINSKPWSYKRQTLLKEPNEKYYYTVDHGDYTIVDSTQSDKYRYVYNAKRKYVPIFFDEYFKLNFLKYDDYEFYYNRPYETGNIYFSNAKLGNEIFGENGFIFPIDRVARPAENAKQLLSDDSNGNSYADFLELIYRYPEFTFNKEATFNQEEAKGGGQFDSLFNLSYPELLFDIHEEEYKGNYALATMSHFGLMAPTDDAYQKLVHDVITSSSGFPHWPSMDAVPEEIIRIIINSYMSEYPVYRTNFNEGFYNGRDDKITIDEQDIIQAEFGSNCTFLGLKEPIVPRAFTSVTGPVYLRPGYSLFMRAMEYANILPAVKRENADYAFYVIPDEIMNKDSSLMIKWDPIDPKRYTMQAYDRTQKKVVYMSRSVLSKRLLNQVGLVKPTGVGRKEFIENLAGNYLVIDNENNVAMGSGGPNCYGYMGDSVIETHPVKLPEPADNGSTLENQAWFKFSKSTLFAVISSHTEFYNLLVKAGLIDPKNYKFTFISEGDYYTVFVPTDEALASARLDTLSTDDLRSVLQYHFIRDVLIFTDGRMPSGLYETARKDESSNEFSTVFSTINLDPGVDYIDILDEEGNLYYRVDEEDGKTNSMATTKTGDANKSNFWDFITTGVVHEIDTVLIK